MYGTGDPTDSVQPLAATQWLGASQASNSSIGKYLPHGAYEIWAGQFGDQGNTCWVQKYAEIKLPWHSQSWFGPCGKDRDLTIGQTCDPATCELTAGLKRWPTAFAIEGDRGITIDGSDPTKVRVDKAVTYLRDAAANTAKGTGASGDKVDFTSDDGLTVDDNSGAGYEVTEINDGTHSDDGTFMYFKIGSAAPTAKSGKPLTAVKSHGAPGFWCYDSDGKGDFLSIQHVRNYRYTSADLNGQFIEPAHIPLGATYGAVQSAAKPAGYEMDRDVVSYTVTNRSLRFNRCYPAVMCYSPNGETWSNGITIGFGTCQPDVRYGATWQGIFRQVQPDYIWVAPPPQCGTMDEETGFCSGGCNPMHEDPMDGSATTDGCYYAYPPLVEARDGAPPPWIAGDTAPTIPTANTTGGPDQPEAHYLTLAEMQATGHHGIVVPPEGVATGPIPGMENRDVPREADWTFAPWNMWIGFQNIICTKGPFYEDYKKQIGCWICGPDPTV